MEKLFIENLLFKNIGNDYLLKIKQIIIMHRLRINPLKCSLTQEVHA